MECPWIIKQGFLYVKTPPMSPTPTTSLIVCRSRGSSGEGSIVKCVSAGSNPVHDWGCLGQSFEGGGRFLGLLALRWMLVDFLQLGGFIGGPALMFLVSACSLIASHFAVATWGDGNELLARDVRLAILG